MLLEIDDDHIELFRSAKKKKLSLKPARIDHLPIGRVTLSNPGGIHISCQGINSLCSIRGSLKKELQQQKDRICCGDLVSFDPQKKQVVALQKRTSLLHRQNPSQKHTEQILAANIDVLLITTAVLEPSLNPYLIDLYLITAKRAGLSPVIVFNKVDLLNVKNPSEQVEKEKALLGQLLDQYQRLKIPCILVSASKNQGFKPLYEIMKDKASVFSGESGVGKSSLINALEKKNLKTSGLSLKNMKGTHTTSTSMLFELQTGGWCVDTPGVQSMGFKNLDPMTIKSLFPEMNTPPCKFSNCLHLNEKGCEVQKSLDENTISKLRLSSYYRLLKESK